MEKGLMPSYQGKLTAEQIADIVNYLASLKGVEK
jgi:mono/diheme cytochrome c family protein